MSRRVPVQLRWSDLDAQAHLNNVQTLGLLQEARASFFMDSPLATMLGAGVVVVEHKIEYRASVEFTQEPLAVDVSVIAAGASKFAVGYALYRGDVLATRASTTLCPFDFATGLPRRLLPDERAFLKGSVEPAEPLSQLPTDAPDDNAHRLALQVRWGDQDHYGHVNNVHYLDYVQQARVELMIDADRRSIRMGHEDAAFSWLIVRQDIQYKAQLNYRREPCTVRTSVAKLGRTSVAMVYDISDGQTTFATAQSVLVCADHDGNPQAIPADLRAGLASHALPGVA